MTVSASVFGSTPLCAIVNNPFGNAGRLPVPWISEFHDRIGQFDRLGVRGCS